MFLANIVPTLGGPLLFGSHAYVHFLWLFVRVTETCFVHSGYNVPFSPFELFSFQGGTDRHDFHHTHNIGSYGSWTNIWDRLMGTDKQFVAWQKKEKRTTY